MGRIRTIKPEFPQSETIGKLSRDARLLWVQLWTIVDDLGRARAACPMIAGQLYPYDNDAPQLINGWLTELELNGCIRRYEVDGKSYLDIPKWLEHQKINRPTPSRLPEFSEASVSPHGVLSEASLTDLGPWTLDQDLPRASALGISRAGAREDVPTTADIAYQSPDGLINFTAQKVDEMYRDLPGLRGMNIVGMIRHLDEVYVRKGYGVHEREVALRERFFALHRGSIEKQRKDASRVDQIAKMRERVLATTNGGKPRGVRGDDWG